MKDPTQPWDNLAFARRLAKSFGMVMKVFIGVMESFHLIVE
jgi:hypothetical protein